MGKKDAPKVDEYYGSAFGLLGIGPATRLRGHVMDGKLIWPEASQWADGLVQARTSARKRTSNVVKVWTESEHGLKNGQKVTITDFTDGSFNTVATTVSVKSALAFTYANVGGNVGKTDDPAGLVTKNVNYTAGDIIFDGTTVWTAFDTHLSSLANRPPSAHWTRFAINRADVGNPFSYSVAVFGKGYGSVDFYWGTNDQILATDADPTSARSLLISMGNPPYRNQIAYFLRDFLQGQERVATANHEFLIDREPVQDVITGDSALVDADGQVNAMAVAAEWWRSPIVGIGRGSDKLNEASWQTIADELQPLADSLGLSVVVRDQQTFRKLMAALISYYDGWFRFGPDGKVVAGRFAHNVAPPAFDASNTINFHSAIKGNEIRCDATGWGDTFNKLVVTYTDRMAAFKTLPAQFISSGNRNRIGELKPVTLDRPWIVRASQANTHAAEYGKINAKRKLSSSVTQRAEKVAGVLPGDRFLLTHDSSQVSIICRALSKTRSKAPAGTVVLEYESDRAISRVPYQPTPANPGGTHLPSPESISLYQLVQVPPAMVGNDPYVLSVLAARTSPQTVGLRVYFQQEDGALFYLLGEQKRWGVTGTLTQNYANNLPVADTVPPDDDTETLQLLFDEHVISDDIDSISADQSADAINDSNLLVWLFNAADRSQFELMTLKSIRLDAGVYKLKVRRGRFGTVQQAFSTGDIVWIGYRADLSIYTHIKFKDYAASGQAATFRLAASTSYADADQSDTDVCPDIAFTFANPFAPSVAWTSELYSTGGGAFGAPNFANPFLPEDIFAFTFLMSSPSGTLTEGRLVARLGSLQLTLWSKVFAPSASQAGSAQFSIPTEGCWRVYAVAIDQSGLITEKELAPVGGGAAEQVCIQTAAHQAGGNPTTPFADPIGDDYPYQAPFYVTLSTPTAGATIYYKIVSYGTAAPTQDGSGANTGGWTAYTVHFTVALTTFGRTVYAYAHNGSGDSAIAANHYFKSSNL